MKSFLKRLAGGRCSFRDLGMGETAALSLSKGMRTGQGLSASGGIPRKQAAEKTSPEAGKPVSFGTKERVSWYSLISIKNALRS
jgi:hypothetical protein